MERNAWKFAVQAQGYILHYLPKRNWDSDRENAIKTKTCYYFQGFGGNLF